MRTQKRIKTQRKAHYAVWLAVATGRLVKPKRCERCGKEMSLQGHHRSYSRPLDVVWLCFSCHRKEHSRPSRKKPLDELLVALQAMAKK